LPTIIVDVSSDAATIIQVHSSRHFAKDFKLLIIIAQATLPTGGLFDPFN